MSAKVANLAESSDNSSHTTQGYSLSEKVYSYGYDLRLSYSSFMQDTLNWVSQHKTELLPPLGAKVLSLGCGSGLFDIELINIIRQNNAHWSFTGLDFSATDLNIFQEKLRSMDEQTHANISLLHKNFSPTIDLAERYDLITMVHFLHSFDDVAPILRNAIRHLSSNGKLLIVQQNKGAIAELKEALSDVLDNQKFHTSEKIKALIQSENINFSTQIIDTRFDVSILQKRTLDGLLLMSFCLCNDLSVLDIHQQEKIRKAFLNQADEIKNGGKMIREQMEVLVCQA